MNLPPRRNEPPQRAARAPAPRRAAWRVGLAGLGLAAALALPARAQVNGPVEAEGYTYEAQTSLAGQSLQLNGVGLRAVAWLKGYSAGLYLRQRTRRADVVLADGGPKRVRLRVLLDVSPEEFVKGFDRGVAKNSTPEQLAALNARMQQFDAMVRSVGPIRKGAVFDIDYLPATGTVLSLNARPLGKALPGDDFYAAFLRIFLGNRPVDDELKDGLLGGPVR